MSNTPTPEPMDRATLAHLVGRYMFGSISDDELERLNIELQQYTESRARFVEYSAQISMLRDLLGGRAAANELTALNNDDSVLTDGLGSGFDLTALASLDDTSDSATIVDVSDEFARREMEARKRNSADSLMKRPLPGQSTSPSGNHTRHYVIPKPLFYGSIATVIAIAAAIIWSFVAPSNNPTNIENVVKAPPIEFVQMATLVEEFGAVWLKGAHEIGIDKPLYNEKITLHQGLAKLRFNNGAEVVIEGPITFQPLAVDQMELISGKLLARCDTPQSKKFTIVTETSRIVDLGTEFGVRLDNAGEHEIHVFEGLVELRDADENKILGKRIAAREAVRYRKPAKAESIEPDINVFAASTNGLNGYVRTVMWDQPIAYYRFEGEDILTDSSGNRFHARRAGTLPDQVTSATARLGHAVSFSKDAIDHLVLPKLRANGTVFHESVTVSFFVKCPAVPIPVGQQGWLITNESTPDGRMKAFLEKGLFNLKIQGEGEIVLGIRKNSGSSAPWRAKDWYGLYSPNNLDELWHHLVFVVDRENELIRSYIDGQVWQELSGPIETTVDFRDLIVGASNFEGLMDEVAIFDYALSKQQVRIHYDQSLLNENRMNH